MHPELARLAVFGWQLQIKAYTTFLFLALFTAIILGAWTAQRQGLNVIKAVLSLVMAGTAAIIGARFLHISLNPMVYSGDPAKIFALDRTGFSVYGGILAATLVIILTARWFGFDLWRYADSLVPAIGAGIITVRIGCFLNGCCGGKPTTLPWGVIFPSDSEVKAQQALSFFGVKADLPPPLAVHPTQTYEIIAAVVAMFIALFVYKKIRISGISFLSFAVIFTAWRWINWYLREIPSTFAAPMWFYPALYGNLIVICIVIITYRLKSVVDSQ